MIKLKLRILSLFERLIQVYFIQLLSFKRLLHISKSEKITTNSIVVFNTYDLGGGAAKIARQLTVFFKDTHLIRLYVKIKKSKENWIHTIQSKQYSYLEEVLRRESVKKGWIEFTGFHALSLMEDSFFKASSIVHLHNLHGEFFSPILFKSLFKGKKVIWTLHDESFITGHCSCTLGCNQWLRGCGNCPDLNIYPAVSYDNTKAVLEYKKKWITALQPVVVSPSHWLANRVRLSYPELNNIEVIPNGVDVKLFYPQDKIKIRKILDFPIDKKIVLFVAEFATQNPFKGGFIFRDILSDPFFSDLIFITVGGKQETSFTNHVSYPYITDEIELSKLYAACDVLLYPTQADNLPLVVLESMACGTLVIASNVGGIPEIINEYNGFLIEEYENSNEFKHKLKTFIELDEIELKEKQENARSTIVNDFNFDKMTSCYQQLYCSIHT
jgi:glycosyltransferase involved in cell wall biosynthesis